jgi:transposase
MDQDEKSKRSRRIFTADFKADAVRLCQQGDRRIAQVAADLGVNETNLRAWVRQSEIDVGSSRSDALTSDERRELARLRKENKRLTMEREILKKATAFFAREST